MTSQSLFEYDAGYYEYAPDVWLAGKRIRPDACYTFSRRAADAAVNFKHLDSDVIMAAYPKTGQTWLMTMVHLIQHAKELESGRDFTFMETFANMPFFEAEYRDGTTGADFTQTLNEPRFLKTHMPFKTIGENLRKYPKVKIILSLRNPKDTLVSWYHHNSSDACLGAFNGTWDQYFDLVKQKRLAWGDYFEHTLDWYNFATNRENSLILKYEEMKKDHKGHVLKIAKFLGYDMTEKAADLVVEKSSVKTMSEKSKGTVTPDWDESKSSFVRKGQVGDWVNYFSDEQNRYVEERMREVLKPCGLDFQFE